MAKKFGKKYTDLVKDIDLTKIYESKEAFEIVKKVSYTKFEWTVEVSIKTNANPKYNDQMIRGTVVLPEGTGKEVKVAAFVSDDKIEEAKKAGADIAGNEELIKEIQKWEFNFDSLITSLDMMRDLSKVAKILWPRGLMPSPKAGTVTNDISYTVSEIKKWRVEFKLDKTWNIHTILWKTSFDSDKLVNNLNSLLKAIEDSRPSWVKWKLIKKIVVSPTMGAWVQVSV